jgi:hypothetical protein
MVRWPWAFAAGTGLLMGTLTIAQPPAVSPPSPAPPVSVPSSVPTAPSAPGGRSASLLNTLGKLPSPPPSQLSSSPAGGAETIGSQRLTLKAADLTLKRVINGANSASWQIWAGNRLFRDFADDEESARAVLTTLRDQRPDEWFIIGLPYPLVEYGLVNGQPPLMWDSPQLLPMRESQAGNEPHPAGSSPSRLPSPHRPIMSGVGLHAIQPMDLRTIRLEQIQGVWVLRDDHNLLINFADQRAAGEQAVAAIRRHGLNRLGLVGRHRPVFRCLFSGTDKGNPVLPEPIRRQHLQLQSEALNPVGLAVPGLGYAGLLHRFDPRTLSIRKRDGQWQIVTPDDYVLGQFGPAESHALEALRVLRDGSFTAVARYGPITLLFRQDQIAQRLPLHTQVRVFDPHTLRVVTSGPRCFVADQTRHLCDCRDPAEGRTIIAILQAYGCNLLAHLGPTPRQGLTFFARHP